ncbi:MAG TPA: twin-arginine translocation signal domain-containing protein, partial [Anaerolineae bacterium]|nr:twin-arginine translocation signal domain-containing protein [Anaerolineae bacterium]
MESVSRRGFLKGLAGAGLCALAGGAAWADWQWSGDTEAVGAQASLPEHAREAMYYASLDGGLDCASCHAPAEPSRALYCHVPHQGRYVRCQLCPHLCILAEGERGTCRVRENRNGKLYTFVYGNPCAINVDPIEKKPFYHFLPGTTAFSLATAGCN